MADLSRLTDEDLFRIAGIKPEVQRKDLSSYSDEALMQIAEERKDVGEIRKAPSVIGKIGIRAKRFGAGEIKALTGDIPFIRKILPEEIQKYEPTTIPERLAFGGTRLGRDIGLLRGIGKLGILRTGLRGAGIGIATAGTEKPEEILGAGTKGAITLPVVKASMEKVIVPVFQKIARKGLKTAQQMWQDFIRAGFTVEKSTVERVQQKGLQNIFTKEINPQLGVSNRDDTAYLKLAEKIHDSAINIRRYWGDKVGRWRNILFKDPRIEVDISRARNTFQTELARVGTEVGAYDPKAVVALREIDNLLSIEKETLSPKTVYTIIDKLDDMVSASKRGVLTFGKNEGRIVGNLMRDLKQHIYNAAPRHLRQGLQATEAKFANVAEITDDVFDKLKLVKEGVAQSERIGAAEQALARGLRMDVPAQEKAIWMRLNDILPSNKKFIELYKDVFSAQDLQREGIGWLFRRLALSPRMAAFGLQTIQPIMKGVGMGLRGTGEVARRILPPILLRKSIEQKVTE